MRGNGEVGLGFRHSAPKPRYGFMATTPPLNAPYSAIVSSAAVIKPTLGFFVQ
jgi:hypothetical protein